MLKLSMEQMGVKVKLETITTHIVGAEHVTGLQFKDGSSLETDMVVVSTGIRPITEIATDSGLTVERGIVCDDQMRTTDPDIFAVGECAQHRGMLYGLVDPIWDQARTIADVLTGVQPEAAYDASACTFLVKFSPAVVEEEHKALQRALAEREALAETKPKLVAA